MKLLLFHKNTYRTLKNGIKWVFSLAVLTNLGNISLKVILRHNCDLYKNANVVSSHKHILLLNIINLQSFHQLLPVKEFFVCLAIGISCPPYSYIFQKSKIFNLMLASFFIKQLWWLLVIGFNAADIVWFLKESNQKQQYS